MCSRRGLPVDLLLRWRHSRSCDASCATGRPREPPHALLPARPVWSGARAVARVRAPTRARRARKQSIHAGGVAQRTQTGEASSAPGEWRLDSGAGVLAGMLRHGRSTSGTRTGAAQAEDGKKQSSRRGYLQGGMRAGRAACARGERSDALGGSAAGGVAVRGARRSNVRGRAAGWGVWAPHHPTSAHAGVTFFRSPTDGSV
jgi:hypothetical protein